MRFIFIFIFFNIFFPSIAQQSLVGRTEIIKTDNGFQFFRDGKPYYVKGAGGNEYLDVLHSIGGNSIRTWSTGNAQEILDEAHKYGISVCLGLWVGHERHGFDYNDEYACYCSVGIF